MTKIALIGAGSHFGGTLSRDILSLPELRDSHIVLCDINQERLDGVVAYVQGLAEKYRLPARVSGTTDRRKALDGAEFVVTSISAGGPLSGECRGQHPAQVRRRAERRGYDRRRRYLSIFADRADPAGCLSGHGGALPGRSSAQLHEPDVHVDMAALGGVADQECWAMP
jgi:hypothetical protein